MKPQKKEAEEQLLVGAAQKDPRRFAELYEKNFDRIYAYVMGRVHNREEAEDLTAEVFHQALANLGRFEWRGVPFAAWLLRIASNSVADYWQRAARARRDPPREDTEEINLEEIEQRARLFQLVRSLPADQRRVVLKRFVQHRSVREIAREFGRTEGAVKQLQFRALENLRARMRKVNG